MGQGERLARLGTGEPLVLASSLDGSVEIDEGRVSVSLDWIPAERVAAVLAVDASRAALVTNGIEIAPLRGAGLRAAGGGALRVDAAAPEAQWDDADALARARARARLYVASLLLGVMRAACEFSCAYAQEREAFGRPIGHHQGLAFLITDMRIAVDAARMLVHEAAWRVDQGLPAEAAAASAFAQCIEAARTIGPDGVQILGGHGFMADYPVEKHMREARALGLMLGGYDAAIEEAGHSVCAQAAPLALHAAQVI
jgi:alkylation response protein AidB-like acyl-CoA dehydrogenase